LSNCHAYHSNKSKSNPVQYKINLLDIGFTQYEIIQIGGSFFSFYGFII